MTRKWFPGTILIILFLATCTATAWACEETVIKNFLVEEGVAVSVSSIRGKVAIEGHRETVVNMVAAKYVKGLPEEKARELLSQVDIKTEVGENTIRIATEPPDTLSNPLLSLYPPRVNYLLAIPKSSRVNVQTISGAIKVKNIGNEVEAKTVSGETLVQGLAGKVKLESISGKITVERLLGNLEVRTVSGRVEVAIPPSEDPLEINISSVSGDVLILVHEREGFELSVETVCGQFLSEIPLRIREGNSPGWQTFQGRTIVEPRKKIVVKTTSGDILIKKL